MSITQHENGKICIYIIEHGKPHTFIRISSVDLEKFEEDEYPFYHEKFAFDLRIDRFGSVWTCANNGQIKKFLTPKPLKDIFKKKFIPLSKYEKGNDQSNLKK